MAYIDLLSQNEWHQKCQEILDRDKFHCQDCGCLGSHDYGYSQLHSLHDLDILLDHCRFKGEDFASFYKYLSKFDLQDMVIGVKEIRDFTETLRIICFTPYDADWLHSFGNAFNVIVDSRYSKDTLLAIRNVKYRQSKIMSLEANNDSDYGWLFYFRFDRMYSNDMFLSIHHYTDYILICISTGSELIAMRFPPAILNIKGLNVHHKYYMQGLKPWEYPNDALITLCEDCHKKRHHESTIPVYNPNLLRIDDLSPCTKCGGSGYLPQYLHIKNGVCFKCGGEGIELDNDII